MDENALRAVGIDYDAALARFMGKQAIYEKYLRKLPEDAHMKAAWTALEQQDEAELLEQVHAIKGLTGTLGITGLFEQSAAIVALLRAGTREELQEKMTSLKQEWDRVSIEAVVDVMGNYIREPLIIPRGDTRPDFDMVVVQPQ